LMDVRQIDSDIGSRLRRDGTILEGEDLTVLADRWLFVQAVRGYRFGIDAVLLARYASGLVGSHVPESASVLDIGAGCGVVGLILADLCPRVTVTGIEIQTAQADRARRNVALNGLEERVTIRTGDVREFAATGARFDLVVSNPPFYRAGSGRVNPDGERAVARHEISLDMDGLLEAVSRLMAPGGRAVVLYPAERLSECVLAAGRHGLAGVELVPLLPRPGAQPESFLVGLAEGIDGSARDPVTAPPMCLSREAPPAATSECGR